jgi:hypothetical protein
MASDVSIVGLTGIVRNQGRIWNMTNDFSSTIASGARSSLTNITGIGPFNKMFIIGVAIVSEANTNWRIKFYKKDTGIGAAYNTDTYIGDVEITSLSSTAGSYFEGSVECSIPYWDADNSNEIHIIVENIGTLTSKLFINILFSEAD